MPLLNFNRFYRSGSFNDVMHEMLNGLKSGLTLGVGTGIGALPRLTVLLMGCFSSLYLMAGGLFCPPSFHS